MFRIKNNRGVTVTKTKNLSPALPAQEPLKFVRKNLVNSIKPVILLNKQSKAANGSQVLNKTNQKGQISHNIIRIEKKVQPKINNPIQSKNTSKLAQGLNKTIKSKLIIKAKPNQKNFSKEQKKDSLNFVKQQTKTIVKTNSNISQFELEQKNKFLISSHQTKIEKQTKIANPQIKQKTIQKQIISKQLINNTNQQINEKFIKDDIVKDVKIQHNLTQNQKQRKKQVKLQQQAQQKKRKKILQQEQDLKRRQQQCRLLAQKIKQRQRRRKQQKQLQQQREKQRQKIQNQLHAGIMYSKDPLAHFQFSDAIMDAQINKILKTSFNHFPSGKAIQQLKQNLQRINQSYMATKYQASQKKMNQGLNNYRIQIFNRIGELIVADGAQGYNNSNFSIIETDARHQKINDDVHITRGIPKHKINMTLQTKIAKHQSECGICLQNIQINQQYYQLPCHHEFHIHCCGDWVTNTANCPLCRKNLKL